MCFDQIFFMFYMFIQQYVWILCCTYIDYVKVQKKKNVNNMMYWNINKILSNLWLHYYVRYLILFYFIFICRKYPIWHRTSEPFQRKEIWWCPCVDKIYAWICLWNLCPISIVLNAALQQKWTVNNIVYHICFVFVLYLLKSNSIINYVKYMH